MQKWLNLAVGVACCLTAGISCAGTIKYTDKNGTLCFVDDLSKVPKPYRKNVVREQVDEPVQVTSSDEQGTPGTGGGYDSKRVLICYGEKGVGKDAVGRDITDFLAARKYPYQTLRVTGNLEHTKTCAEMWCTLKEKREGAVLCLDAATKNIERHVSFTVVGDKLIPHTGTAVQKEIDLYFRGPGSGNLSSKGTRPVQGADRYFDTLGS